MASSDAGTSLGSKYEVFLSFRGPDTRAGFTDFLFHSLTDAGICVFRDDEELRVGEKIDESLLQAIDNSKIYIPIFSRTYATSKWCLRELTQIVASTFKSEDAWREALMKVGAIKGWEVKKYKGHGELIKLVLEEVMKKLKTKHRLVTEHFVGMDDQVEEISKLLDINTGGVRLVKIYGMGGSGKTTLAKVVFNLFSSCFGKCCCFLEDVRVKSSRINGLVDLQKKLLSEIGHRAGTRSIDEIDYGAKSIGEALCNKKVFIVFDDVDNNEQVEKLVGKTTFYSGSRIFITTRNKDVLRINRPNYQILDYEMKMMSIDHALELLGRHAFDRDSPPDDYKDLVRQIVYATGRLPLALELIGSFLYHKPQDSWKETLDKLRRAPHEDIFGKLKISYDALTSEQQQIFLDIACFFIGEDKMNAIYMWKDCEFFPNTGLDVLISMSLIKIVENNKFWMHDQLRDFGREIVRQENPTNPNEQSRIWNWEEFLEATRTNKSHLQMNQKVQALSVDISSRSSRDVIIQSKEIERFEHLRFLKLARLTIVANATNHLPRLRWISLSHTARIYKWTNMYLKNVVILEFSKLGYIDDSRLENIIKMATKLKVLSLESCHHIIKMPDFTGCLNLERLALIQCYQLRKIDGSIGKLKYLIDLKIDHCNFLEHLPEEIGDLVSLQYFFVKCAHMKKLPDSIWKLKSLREMHFSNCVDTPDSENFWELPSAIELLQSLEVLQVESHNLIGQLPSGIGSLPFLRTLNLSSSCVSVVPMTISMLPRLQRVELMGCDGLEALPTLPTSLTHLRVFASLLIVPDLSNLTNLVELELSDSPGARDRHCTGELWWLGRLSKLTKLSIKFQKVHPPTEMASIPLLNELAFLGLDLQTFPPLPLKFNLMGFNFHIYRSCLC
ncbi:hypothetical protein BT93_L5923 [Corymbia citriodora subsp. variegata]|uniref:TIR domain-containing protein n=2 Tax=Corymbia citriodora subsp. variegata TaxID=360336 RepID=A0A8T0CR15_CORYI|nr:hypothetical protein BT93_L5923 [Corymbia citriodora subsp. variegata]